MRLIKFSWWRGRYDLLDVEVHVMRRRVVTGKVNGTAKSIIEPAGKTKRPVDITFGFTPTTKGTT